MCSLSFSISADAATWIQGKLRIAERETALTNLIPALAPCLNYQVKDGEGRAEEYYSGLFFDIGWYRPESANALCFVEIEILDLKAFALPEALELLKGKQLVLETVEVGFPKASDKTVQLLVYE